MTDGEQSLKDAKAVAEAMSRWLDNHKVDSADGTSAMAMLIGIQLGHNAENLADLLEGYSPVNQMILVTAMMTMKKEKLHL